MGRPLVGSDQHDRPTQRAFLQQHPQPKRHHRKKPHWQRNTEPLSVIQPQHPLRIVSDSAAAGDQNIDPLKQGHHAKGSQDRRNADPGNQYPIAQTNDHRRPSAGQQRRQRGGATRRIARRYPSHHQRTGVGRRDNGQINAAAKHGHGHRQRQDPQHRHLRGNRLEIADRPEDVWHGDAKGDNRQQQQADQVKLNVVAPRFFHNKLRF